MFPKLSLTYPLCLLFRPLTPYPLYANNFNMLQNSAGLCAWRKVKLLWDHFKSRDTVWRLRHLQRGPFSDTQSHQNGVKIHFASSAELLKHVETAWLINKGDGADPWTGPVSEESNSPLHQNWGRHFGWCSELSQIKTHIKSLIERQNIDQLDTRERMWGKYPRY